MNDKKQIITIIIVTIVITGLIGFYGGRYYERTTFRKDMQSKNITGQNSTRKDMQRQFHEPVNNR